MCVVMDDMRQSGGKKGSKGRREEEKYNNLKVNVSEVTFHLKHY